ncbi:hemagglutinin, partial [Enterobacteriaceae bacterium RIT692]|nr:hemagglutinin [Enterobacteriaceae bacterium RIT692]
SEGKHSFRAEVTDAAGNKTASGNFQLEIDVTAPDAADDVTAEDNVGPITGPILDGDTTDDSTPTFGGTGEPGDTVIVKDNDDVIGSTIVGEDGSWEFTPETPLEEGEHSVIVIIEDPAGNQSNPSDPIDFIVDLSDLIVSIDYAIDDAGSITGNMSSGTVTDDATPTLVGMAKPNSIVEIFDGGVSLGSVQANAFGKWSFTPAAALSEGEHQFTAVATDATGNVSAPTAEFALVIDTTAPTKPGEGGTGGDGIGDVIDDVGPIQGSVGNGGVTDDTTPTLEGSSLQPGDVVTIIDNGQPIGSAVADENGGWQFTPDTPLNDGAHDFTVIVTDPAGNSSEESDPYTVIVDTEAPAAPVIKEVIDDQGSVTGPIQNGGTTDDAQPEIRGSAEAGSTVIIYDKGVEIGRTEADANGEWTFIPVPPLMNGDHELSAKAQDKAGNIGDESNKVDFDLIAGGNATAPAITGAWDDVEAKTGMLHSGDVTNDARPELQGTAKAGDVVTIVMDGKAQGSVVADSNGRWTWTPTADLAEGVHNFRAEVKDTEGQIVASGDFALEIDVTAPDAADDVTAEDNVGPITGPILDGDTTDDSTPTFGGTGEPGDTVIVKDNDDVIGSTIVGEDGSWEFTPETPLEEGEHSVIVIIEDPAGNQSNPSDPIDFIVDLSDLIVSIDYAIDDVEAYTGNMASGTVTNDDTPTLVGMAKPNSIVEIFDGGVSLGTVQANGFGKWSFTPAAALSEGTHMFTAVATDATGNVSAPTAEFALVIDTTAPTKPGEGGTGGTGGDGIGDIIDDVGPIQGSVGNGDVTDDTTPTLEGSGLQPGDVVTIIDNGQPIGSAVADENGGWQFTPDTPLNEGAHDFTVIVTDPAGNSSEESDPYTVIIDTQAPLAPAIVDAWDDVAGGVFNGSIANGGVTNDPTPELRGTAEAGSIVTIYKADGSVQGSTTADSAGKWSWTPSTNLGEGMHEFYAKAMDEAGNVSPKSPAFNIEVDTVAPNAPVISGAEDNVAGGIVGPIANGGLTNDNRPT